MPGELARRWLVLGSLAVVFVNDQIFKGASWFPQAIAGKLSDFGGLFAAPIVVCSAAEVPLRRLIDTRWYAAAAALSGAAFAGAKISGAVGGVVGYLYAVLLAPLRLLAGGDLRSKVVLARDPTDLWALSASVMAVIYVRGCRRVDPDLGR